MSIKILATGDIHIGLKVSGPDTGMRDFSARETWDHIVNWSVMNHVDIIALSGDIIDRDNRFFEAAGSLQSGFTRLKDNNIKVFLVTGNHDYDVMPQIISTGNFNNVKILGQGGTWELINYEKENEKLQFAGWSFPSQHVRRNALKEFDLNDEIDPGIPCIGLLHADFGVNDSLYCPVTYPDFVNLNVGTWILGHIHKPQELNRTHPYIFYPGSPLALSSKEQGLHSPVLITVKNKSVSQPERVLHSPIRFESINIDISALKTKDDLRPFLVEEILEKTEKLENGLTDEKFISYDLTLKGTHKNPGQIESWTYEMKEQFSHEMQGTKIGLHKIRYNIQPEVSDLRELAKQNSPVGILARLIIAIENEKEEEILRYLLNKWRENYIAMHSRGIYLPLKKSVLSDNEVELTGKQFILTESKRLLGNLLQQKSE